MSEYLSTAELHELTGQKKPGRPKLVPVSVWAAAHYDPPPSDWVLRKWCRQGEIYPAPERVGKEWRCLENARRLTGAVPVGGGLLSQLRA